MDESAQEQPLTVLEARATPAKDMPPEDGTIGAQALSHLFFETEPLQPTLRAMYTEAAKSEQTIQETFLAEAGEKRDLGTLTKDLQNKLSDYRSVVDDAKRTELAQSILGDCHESAWRGMTDGLVGALSVQERDFVMTLTHEETARRFAEVLGKPGSFTASLGLARREWQLHKGIVTAVESRKFQEANPEASEDQLQEHVSKSLKVEFGKVTLSAVGDMLKDNPEWAKSALSAAAKFIFTNLFNTPTSTPAAAT